MLGLGIGLALSFFRPAIPYPDVAAEDTRVTEADAVRITEAGDTRVTE